MNYKQQKFAEEYIKTMNATQSAINAGYSAKTAYSNGQRLLKNAEVKKYIEDELEKMKSERIADAQEVLEYLTSVMRGTSESEVVVVEGCGDGYSEARRISKNPDEKEKLKAADSLAKILGIAKEKVELSAVQVALVDDVPEDW